MDGYDWVKLVHVAAAIVAVGTNVTYVLWLRRVRRDPTHRAFALEGIQTLDRLLANPAYVVLPITGIAMVLLGDLGFTTFWIAVSIALYVALGAFAGGFFSPALKRQLAIAQLPEAEQDGYGAAARRTMATGAVTLVLVAAIVSLMVLKPV
ncbi:MAG TPA: DUF2269 family protein [Egibacteraceae bacterium]